MGAEPKAWTKLVNQPDYPSSKLFLLRGLYTKWIARARANPTATRHGLYRAGTEPFYKGRLAVVERILQDRGLI